MASLIASQSADMLDLGPLLGTFTEQTGTRIVLVLPGTPERTMIFTGTFTYEDPDVGFSDGDLPDDFDFGSFNPDDFGGLLPDDIADLLDQYDGVLPDIGEFEAYDVWGKVTGIEQVSNGATVWKATGLDVPLGNGEGEEAIVSLLGLFMSGFSGPDLMIGSDFGDTLQGYDGNDTIEGGLGIDLLFGMEGDDVLRPGSMGDTIYGNEGFDTVIIEASRDDFEIGFGNGGLTIRNKVEGGPESIYWQVEKLVFEDGDGDPSNDELPVSVFDGIATRSAEEIRLFVEMYIAYFDRAPDAPGLFYWGTRLSEGMQLNEIARSFFDQPETIALYPDPSDAEYNAKLVDAVYSNVLGRAADPLGREYWINELDLGKVEPGVFILTIIDGAKNFAAPNASPELIAQAEADVRTITDKADIGLYYSAIKGLGDPFGDARTAMELYSPDDRLGSLADAKQAIDAFAEQANSLDGGTELTMPLLGVVQDPLLFL